MNIKNKILDYVEVIRVSFDKKRTTSNIVIISASMCYDKTLILRHKHWG